MKIRIEVSDDAIVYGMTVETDADISPTDLIAELEKIIDVHISSYPRLTTD